MIVAIQEARCTVARNVNVRPPIVVKICDSGSHAIGSGGLPVSPDKNHGGWTPGTRDTRSLGNIDKGSITLIAIQEIRATSKSLGATRHRNVVIVAINALAGARCSLHIEIHIVRNE